MMIHEVTETAGAHKRRKRVGRGPGSGHGKTAGRGHKGWGSRSGSSNPHEGGQIPFYKRFPKRGFSNAAFKTTYEVVNVKQLAEKKLDEGTRVDAALLAKLGLCRSAASDVKVLGHGELSSRLTLAVAAVSASARSKVEAAGGSVEDPAPRGQRRPKGVKKDKTSSPAADAGDTASG